MQIFHESYFQFVIKYSSQNYISRISTFKIEIEFRSVIFQLSGANLACKSDQLTKKKKNKNEEIFDRLFNEFISNAFFQFETSESRGRNRRIGMEATMRLLSMSDGLTSSNYENGCKTKEGLMRNCKGDKLPTLLLWRNTLCKLCLCPIKFN